jgi:hypothetical protein
MILHSRFNWSSGNDDQVIASFSGAPTNKEMELVITTMFNEIDIHYMRDYTLNNYGLMDAKWQYTPFLRAVAINFKDPETYVMAKLQLG